MSSLHPNRPYKIVFNESDEQSLFLGVNEDSNEPDKEIVSYPADTQGDHVEHEKICGTKEEEYRPELKHAFWDIVADQGTHSQDKPNYLIKDPIGSSAWCFSGMGGSQITIRPAPPNHQKTHPSQ
ncbi:hypothetical protein TWF569_010026 [Orbilia oligospora]|nr:hypothetical protein TWF569_010026 [Orbilia oligospora]